MKFLFKFLLPLLLAILCCTQVRPNSQDELTREECEQLISHGNKAIKKRNTTKALEYFTKAEVVAEKMRWKDKLVSIKIGLGITYALLSNYGESLGYNQQALDLAEDSADEKHIATVLNNLGMIYAMEEDYDSALRYYKRAYPLTNTAKLGSNRVILAINIAEIYNILGDFKQARKYLDDVGSISKTANLEQNWKVPYADSYFVEGNLVRSQKMMEDLIPKLDHRNAEGFYVVELLSKIYAKQNKTDQAIHFAERGLQSTNELEDKIKLYQRISNLYLQKKQFNAAIQYRDSAAAAKDSMAHRINRGLFAANKVKMKVQEYQNQLQLNREKQQEQQTQRNLLLVVIIVSLVISFLIYRGLKSKILRQNQEKLITELELDKRNREQLIIEKELQNTKSTALLNQELLKNSIAEQNRELSAKALYLSIRNELIEKTIRSLTAIPEVTKNTSVADHIKLLTGHLKSDAGWGDFISQFEKTNPAFLKRLRRKHPDLNGKDIRFICCVFMNLETKEIGNIFNITYDAAQKRKQRIAEKMNIVQTSLYEYLLKFDFDLSSGFQDQDKI